MALPRAEAELLYLRVLGMLRNPRSVHDPREIALIYYRATLARGEAYNFSEYLSVALQAQRSYEAGAALRADPQTTIVPPRGATDPTAPPGTVGYRYRVVVEVYQDGRYVGSTAVNVTSSAPLSAAEVAGRAGDVARGTLPGRDYQARVIREALPSAELRATVISAGAIR